MPFADSQTSAGVYRHRDILVVDLEKARFPNRCVVTNEVVDGPMFRYREKISAQKAQTMSRNAASVAEGFATGAVFGAGTPVVALPIVVLAPVAILAAMKTVILQFGLSESRLQKHHKRRRLALRLIFGGLFARLDFRSYS